jgi:hypothetical protein
VAFAQEDGPVLDEDEVGADDAAAEVIAWLAEAVDQVPAEAGA